MIKICENELKLHRCCFTGHRPHKLNVSEQETKKLLLQAIEQAVADEYVTFISGMAIGVDLWAAEIVLEKKKTNSDLHLIAALPHLDFEKGGTKAHKDCIIIFWKMLT